jgi:LCP family protein required for cell wall assembly
MTLKRKILAIFLSFVMVVVGSGVIYVFRVRANIAGENLDSSKLSVAKLPSGVTNYAVFGIDGRSDVEGNRSDTIMILSVNYKTGEITITSVMRDLMARIPASSKNNVTYEKINAAYSYGGAALAIKTLNENFDLNIEDYISINFDCMMEMVNAVGGITVNITDERVLKYTNEAIDMVNGTEHTNATHLKMGKNHLNGAQALAYARNRHSDDDFGRTERQREVVQKLFKKATKINTFTALKLFSKVYPYITTSMTNGEMTEFLQGYLQSNKKSFTSQRIPFNDYYETPTIGGISYVVPKTLYDTAIQLHQSIYGSNVDYTPSATVNTISDGIVSRSGYGTYHGTSASGNASPSGGTTSNGNGSSSTTSSRNYGNAGYPSSGGTASSR